ncbi:hypothetical protein NESM_000803400 [Novymonas esmeraldas]|uniref:Uncharacterized protein n=1 Tax=Novymonas esmeraldas TaxID=1808958 RepID=A0AAW0EX87_9TRYP
MLRKQSLLFLSAQWRPHSEQLKQWIVSSSSDSKALSLARDYVSNLDIGVLQTFEDGLELTSLLPSIKYPLGTHAMAKIASHLEAVASDLGPAELRQLSTSMSVSPGSLGYYEAVLGSPGVMAALRSCLQHADNAELISFGRLFWTSRAHELQGGGVFASHMTRTVLSMLASRLLAPDDPFAFFDFVVAESVPLEENEMEGIVKQLQLSTAKLQGAALVDLLEKIARPRNSQRYAAWGACIQNALLKANAVDDRNCFSVFVGLLLTGAAVEDSICDRICVACKDLSSSKVVQLLSAWQDADATSRPNSAPLGRVLVEVQKRVRVGLTGSQPEASAEEYLSWVLCLSFFSAAEASALLRDAAAADRVPVVLSPSEVALLCDALISTGAVIPSLQPRIRHAAEKTSLSQRASVHALYVLNLGGEKPPSGLVKKAVGQAGTRLSASRSAKTRAGEELSPRDRAVLIAGLCLDGDEGQSATLKRVVNSKELSHRAAMCLLRLTRKATTNASRWTRKVALSRAMRSLRSCTSEELGVLLSTLSDLGVRDAAALQRIFEELSGKMQHARDAVVAAKAARVLKLTPLFAQSGLAERLGDLADMCLADLVTLLSCCTAKQRYALLHQPSVMAVLRQKPQGRNTTRELVLLFTFLPSSEARRTEVVSELQKSEPLAPQSLSAEDAIAAVEAVVTDSEIVLLSRVLGRVTLDWDESHLMRLFRCASRHTKVPKSYFRLAGRSLLAATAQQKLSLENTNAWLTLYLDNRIIDEGVGKSLVMSLMRRNARGTSPYQKQITRGSLFYSVSCPKQEAKSTRRFEFPTRTGSI